MKVSSSTSHAMNCHTYGKKITESQVDRKIAKTRRHIAHLTQQLSQRNTHGGKRFRSRQIALKEQIAMAINKLNELENAKTNSWKVVEVSPPATSSRSFLNLIVNFWS